MDFFAKLKHALLPPILILAAIVAGYGAHAERDAAALLEHGVNTSARVETVVWQTRLGIERKHRARVVFRPEAGKQAHATIGIDKSLARRIRDGAATHIDITYLPEDPSQAVLAGRMDGSVPTFAASAALAIGGIGLLFHRRRVRQALPATAASRSHAASGPAARDDRARAQWAAADGASARTGRLSRISAVSSRNSQPARQNRSLADSM